MEQAAPGPHLPRLTAVRIAVLYVVVAGLWIWLSDRLLLMSVSDPRQFAQLQTYKGWLFVGVTAFLLYLERAWSEGEMRRVYQTLSQQATALRHANADLAEAQRVAQVGSWSLDVEQDRLTWSDETFRIFGVAPDTFDGRGEFFYQVVHPEDVEFVRQADQEVLARRAPLDYEHRVVHPNGDVRIVHERGYAIYDETGKPVRMFGMVQDITERRRNQEQLQQQERLAVVGQMAAGIAHDFNNILAVIMLYTQMLQLAAQTEVQQRHLATIYQQAVHAANLVEQILDFSRRSSMERIALDMVPFVKEMIKLWQRTLPEHIRIELVCEAAGLTVHADPARLQQALMNIVINARDAMPNGGLLRLELMALWLHPNSSAPLPSLKPGSWLRFTVADTGTGIPPEVMPHLFEPFFTTKPPGKGTGLGLPQVYGIVQQLQGQIQVESTPGEGTQFTIYLPLLSQTDAQPVGAAPMHPPQGRSELILLVEDESALRAAVEEMLTELKYRVVTAQNGTDALAVYAAHSSEIALVLSDLIMPDMGGMELYHALRKRDAQARVLLVTGYLHAEVAEPGSAVQWIQKPFTIGTLAQRVAEALHRA
jgi:PAS domain S-box-containing protein